MLKKIAEQETLDYIFLFNELFSDDVLECPGIYWSTLKQVLNEKAFKVVNHIYPSMTLAASSQRRTSSNGALLGNTGQEPVNVHLFKDYILENIDVYARKLNKIMDSKSYESLCMLALSLKHSPMRITKHRGFFEKWKIKRAVSRARAEEEKRENFLDDLMG